MKFLIPNAIVLFLIYVIWKSIKRDAAIDKEQARYNFENTDGGGTVRYSSFDEMKRLESRWNGARLRMIPKFTGLVVLIIVELIVLAVSVTH
jgi:hypothetical protein